MTQSESMVYRVVPKCACSTIGQIMYYSDHGRFFDGDIHDARDGLHKWGQDHSQSPISQVVTGRRSLVFSCVRNPFDRILSSFFDKICGIQRNGGRYRGNMVPMLAQKYGIETGSPEDGFDFDQIRSFRRFLLFARDTIRFRKPIDPDIHWSPVSGHLSTLIRGGGRYDRILRTEEFVTGMQGVLASTPAPHRLDVAAMPRFNESAVHGPRRAHAVEAYFDDLSLHLMQEVYRNDFALFGYDSDRPSDRRPRAEIDLDAVHARLSA